MLFSTHIVPKIAPTFEYIQTNPTELVNIRMIYSRQESDLGRGHGIVVG